jgi:hypothetical protein
MDVTGRRELSGGVPMTAAVASPVRSTSSGPAPSRQRYVAAVTTGGVLDCNRPSRPQPLALAAAAGSSHYEQPHRIDTLTRPVLVAVAVAAIVAKQAVQTYTPGSPQRTWSAASPSPRPPRVGLRR